MGLQRQGLLSPAPQQQTQAARSISSTAAARTRSLARQRQGLYLCHRSSKVQLYLNPGSFVSVAAAAGTSILYRDCLSIQQEKLLSPLRKQQGAVSRVSAARNPCLARQLQGLYLHHISSRGSISLSRHRDGLRSISITLTTKTLCLYRFIVHVDHCNSKDFVSLSRQQQGLYLCHGSRNGFISFTAEAGILFLA